MKATSLFFALLALFAAGSLLLAGPGLPLSNRSLAIVNDAPDNAVANFAVKELADYLERSLGSKPAIGDGEAAQVRFIIGNGPRAEQAGVRLDDCMGKIAVMENGDVFLLGKDSPAKGNLPVDVLLFDVEFKGTLEAVYTFLEKHLGVRWLEPGPEGEYVPKRSALTLPVGTEGLKPHLTERRCFRFYSLRYWQYNGKPVDLDEYCTPSEGILWGLRLRLTSQAARSQGAHTPGYIRGFNDLIKTRPELFALQKDGTRSNRDMCWSNPKVADLFYDLADCYFSGEPNPKRAGLEDNSWNVHQFTRKDEFMIDPNDYITYCCTCRECRKFMEENGENGRGELIFKTIFDVARRIEKKYPGRYITTLVSPPKFFLSKQPVPANVRIRFTGKAPAMDTNGPKFRQDMELIEAWHRIQKDPLQLWLYIIADFGGEFHGVPEISAANFQKYLQTAWPHIDGVFYEHVEPSQTMCNFDQYCISHLLWDANLDLPALRQEYCECAFGKAAEPMLDFFLNIERLWTKTLAIRQDKSLAQDMIGPSSTLTRIFDEFFTYEELDKLGKLLDQAEKQAAGNPTSLRRIDRYRRHVLELAQQTFGRYVTDKSRLFKQPDVLLCGKSSEAKPDALQIMPWQPLFNLSDGTSGDGRFRMLYSGNGLWIEADFAEPNIAQSSTKAKKPIDGNDYWYGNLAEIFIAPAMGGKMFHFAVDDVGDALLHDAEKGKIISELGDISVELRKTDKNWGFLAFLPNSMTGLNPKEQGNRFHFTRTRGIQGKRQVYFSSSLETKVGCWGKSEYFPVLVFKDIKEVKEGYSGIATQPSEVKAGPQLCTAKTPFYSWVTPPGKSQLKELNGFEGKKGRVFHIDSRKDSPYEAERGASWRCELPVPYVGKKIRASLWMKAETSSPNACLFATVGWNQANHIWYTAQDFTGTVACRANGEWQKLTMDFTVPNCMDIRYMSVSFGCRQLCPGQLWIRNVKVYELP